MIRSWGIAVLVVLGAVRTCPAQAPQIPEELPPKAHKPAPSAVPALPDPGMTPGRGRQESFVTIDWVGPPVAQVGEHPEYTLLVRNTSSLPLHKVQANVRVPAGMT